MEFSMARRLGAEWVDGLSRLGRQAARLGLSTSLEEIRRRILMVDGMPGRGPAGGPGGPEAWGRGQVNMQLVRWQ